MQKMCKAICAMSLLALSAANFDGAARAQAKLEIGTLSCTGQGGVGLILGSQKNYDCTFAPTGGRPTEAYVATVTNIGLDIGVTGKTEMVWAVAASADSLQPGSLSGNYAGVSANAAVGIGGGGKALVGGSNQAVTLQPISAQAQSGLNLAVGVAGLKLELKK